MSLRRIIIIAICVCVFPFGLISLFWWNKKNIATVFLATLCTNTGSWSIVKLNVLYPPVSVICVVFVLYTAWASN